MNGIALLIGLGPLLGWGLFPTIASKIGGKPVNQIIGTTFGTFIFALVYNLVQGIALPSGAALIWSIISGIGWASAQILTFHSFTFGWIITRNANYNCLSVVRYFFMGSICFRRLAKYE